MKYLSLFFILTILSSCASSTEFGRCIGINGKEDQTLNYEWSARNLIVGIVFFGLIAPPVYVALDEIKCPVSKK